MKRGLNDNFISDLLKGKLKEILQFVLKDNTLDIEIRENYINIYYRGGNILNVAKKGGDYSFEFDYNYLTIESSFKSEIEQNLESKNWLRYFAFAKQVMDLYFTKHKKEEREYQQLVVRENNYSTVANGTDYFIIDIEYDNHDNARFDIVALEWLSESPKRKLQGYKPKIVIFEMKYGDGAMTGSASINKHLKDFKKFNCNPKTVNDFKNEMLEIFAQKRQLGLIPCLARQSNKYEIDLKKLEDKIDFAFLIANHDPASNKLKNEINGCNEFFAKFIGANFNGYGLYKTNLYSSNDLSCKYGDVYLGQ